MLPTISVIIPTRNEEKNIRRCLSSIKYQVSSIKYQVSSIKYQVETIVVDNDSGDKTRQIAKKLGARVFQAGPERSAQRNFGARKAKGNILFFIDADMEIGKNVINQAIQLLKKDLGMKAIAIPEFSVGKNYWARVRGLERSCYLNEPMLDAARIFWKKSFLKAGGFDEALVAAEDWDLHQRLKMLGKIGKTKAKIIHHEDKLSLFKHLKKKYYYAKSIKAYAKKHPNNFKAQSGIERSKIFIKNWQKLAADPIHGIGVLVLKSLEYLVFLAAKLT